MWGVYTHSQYKMCTSELIEFSDIRMLVSVRKNESEDRIRGSLSHLLLRRNGQATDYFLLSYLYNGMLIVELQNTILYERL